MGRRRVKARLECDEFVEMTTARACDKESRDPKLAYSLVPSDAGKACHRSDILASDSDLDAFEEYAVAVAFRDWFAALQVVLDPQFDRVSRVSEGFLDGLALRDNAGERRHKRRVAAFFHIGFKDDGKATKIGHAGKFDAPGERRFNGAASVCSRKSYWMCRSINSIAGRDDRV